MSQPNKKIGCHKNVCLKQEITDIISGIKLSRGAYFSDNQLSTTILNDQ